MRAVSDGEETAPSQALAPLENCDIAGLVDDFGNVDHLNSGKVSFKHLAYCRATFDGTLCHLIVHRVFVIKLRNGDSTAFIKSSDELFNHLTWYFQIARVGFHAIRNSRMLEEASQLPKGRPQNDGPTACSTAGASKTSWLDE